MVYAGPAQLCQKWTLSLIQVIAWNDEMGAADEARIESALCNASAIIDGYLSRRYQLPLDLQPDGASLLASFCCDIAVGQLATAPGTRSDVIADAEKRAMAFLRDIADGKASVSIVTPPSAQPEISPNEPILQASPRDFTRNSLRGL